jgi:hypothetical protein
MFSKLNSCTNCYPITSRATLTPSGDGQVKIISQLASSLAVSQGKCGLVSVQC